MLNCIVVTMEMSHWTRFYELPLSQKKKSPACSKLLLLGTFTETNLIKSALYFQERKKERKKSSSGIVKKIKPSSTLGYCGSTLRTSKQLFKKNLLCSQPSFMAVLCTRPHVVFTVVAFCCRDLTLQVCLSNYIGLLGILMWRDPIAVRKVSQRTMFGCAASGFVKQKGDK